MSQSAFSDQARQAIYTAGDHRCIGCGRPDLTAQHRHARGMGGSRDPRLGLPANGVPLCGHGTAGCHGWTEHHPVSATLLGWRLATGQPLEAPFWTRFGWRRWTNDDDPNFWAVAYVDHDDLDSLPSRLTAVDAFRAREACWH